MGYWLKSEYKISYSERILYLIQQIQSNKLSSSEIIDELRDISKCIKHLEGRVEDDYLTLKVWENE